MWKKSLLLHTPPVHIIGSITSKLHQRRAEAKSLLCFALTLWESESMSVLHYGWTNCFGEAWGVQETNLLHAFIGGILCCSCRKKLFSVLSFGSALRMGAAGWLSCETEELKGPCQHVWPNGYHQAESPCKRSAVTPPWLMPSQTTLSFTQKQDFLDALYCIYPLTDFMKEEHDSWRESLQKVWSWKICLALTLLAYRHLWYQFRNNVI